MIPIETMNIVYQNMPVKQEAPAVMDIIVNLFSGLGIHITTVDGQILPGTYLVFVLCVWGSWHLILMGVNAGKAVPEIYRKVKESLKK